MCTVTWLRQADGYVLLCNRDESHTRKPAAGPRVGERRGVAFVAPRDGDHGGSWIGVNQFGLTLCLLNRYGDSNPEAEWTFTSRGLLLTDLLDSERSQELQRRVGNVDLGRFRPFTMAVLAVGEPALLIDWTGRECSVQPNAEISMLLTSSSLLGSKARELRERQFHKMMSQAGKVDAELLYRFHRSHAPAAGPYSVCMHREDAATVSLSAVTVTPQVVELSYQGDCPCSEVAVEKIQLARIPDSQAARVAGAS